MHGHCRRCSDGSGEVMHVPLDAAGLNGVLQELEAIRAAEVGQ